MKQRRKDAKPKGKRSIKASPKKRKAKRAPTPEAPVATAFTVSTGYCTQLPACSRQGCGRPACHHGKDEPHTLYDGNVECPGYEDATGTYAAFIGGGGGFGGGGATVGW